MNGTHSTTQHVRLLAPICHQPAQVIHSQPAVVDNNRDTRACHEGSIHEVGRALCDDLLAKVTCPAAFDGVEVAVDVVGAVEGDVDRRMVVCEKRILNQPRCLGSSLQTTLRRLTDIGQSQASLDDELLALPPRRDEPATDKGPFSWRNRGRLPLK